MSQFYCLSFIWPCLGQFWNLYIENGKVSWSYCTYMIALFTRTSLLTPHHQLDFPEEKKILLCPVTELSGFTDCSSPWQLTEWQKFKRPRLLTATHLLFPLTLFLCGWLGYCFKSYYQPKFSIKFTSYTRMIYGLLQYFHKSGVLRAKAPHKAK